MSRQPRRCALAIVALTPVLVMGAWTLQSSAAAASSLASRSPAQDNGSDSAGGSVLAGVFTSAQASRGQVQFEQTCMGCHTVAEHTGRNFGAKWSGTTLNELFELISTTMPEVEPGSLTPEQYASIVAFFLRASGYPAGQRELPSDVAALKKVRVEPLAK
jgi:mono/diheme cytochrome c family protein